ncbi:SpoVK/Ycf46/Vps4 family AAA+-type ATPase [Alkalihalobacillus xiaoxiensis]|uniref:SpoVK/Ycf46/Vps4 family AAA+-type ATPase n=1 Tax=Shouchella xiaoxiensis TaxID=766895 RepID=A0ABS2SZC0_9BACI|nr:AAA family ATPase [Shouchella xiaoxiensis]MBM7840863.1 SpoVK/Ycf46/Vps4 family AAA+-type ATPase [Shouchella xiaoxiensis]
MFAEIIKIIEGGMSKDQQKVINYSRALAQNLIESGDSKVANKIVKIIDSNNTNLASLDSLITKPFDRESKLETVDVLLPIESTDSLIFDVRIEDEIKDFIMSYYKKDILISNGIETNNNLLLYGPPGTGKTSVAKYISFQLDLPLVIVKLDSLISSMLGSTAKNIRKVFDFASRKPCVLFLDEFDVIAKIRDDKHETGELKRVVNSLLQNIDQFSNESILIAATNHHQLLDKAVWRRFDKILMLDYPEKIIRLKIIQEFISGIKNNILEDKKKINTLTLLFEAISPAEIKSIINTAKKKCVLNNREELTFYDVLYEIYLRNNPSIGEEEELVGYLHEHGVSQKDIVENTGLSMRKVRNSVKKEE